MSQGLGAKSFKSIQKLMSGLGEGTCGEGWGEQEEGRQETTFSNLVKDEHHANYS